MKSIFYLSLSWKAGNYSFFWGKTLEHAYKHRLGTKLPNREQKSLDIEDEPQIKHYDFRDESYILKSRKKSFIRNQEECGASWAFSTIGTL